MTKVYYSANCANRYDYFDTILRADTIEEIKELIKDFDGVSVEKVTKTTMFGVVISLKLEHIDELDKKL